MKTNIGRILYAIPLAVFGLFHFMNANALAGMVPIPGELIWVYLTGVALIAASVSIIIKKKASLATLLLGVLLLIFALSVHLPAVIGGDQNSMPNVLKDIALAGAAFFMSGHFKS